ncbi:MAG: histidinol-phosphate transaminase [Burkholderiales bacterium]|nr:histidinol-phosphate transaminase [Burkholderiales bacterium]
MIDACDLAPEFIRAIAPYVPGKPASELAREMGLDPAGIVKLASNENPLGASPAALAAMQAALDDIGRYPDGNGFALKQAIAAHFGVGLDRIVLGNGSNDVLELVGRTFLVPGTSAVYSRHAFAVYMLTVQAIGATHLETPAQDFGHDLDAMADAIRDDTRIVFVANPNNPTGTFLPGPAIEAFLARVPSRVIVVLDEAYTEYLPDADRYDAVAWLARFPNLVISRTFSKAYGLAGLRVGFALAHPDVADLMNRVRQPFNVNSVAQAGAVAALHDTAFVARSRALNSAGLAQVIDGVTRLGLQHVPSRGNFVLVRVGAADSVYRKLLQRGVIVRPVAAYHLPEWLRVSIGLPEENARFLDALTEVLGGADPRATAVAPPVAHGAA